MGFCGRLKSGGTKKRPLKKKKENTRKEKVLWEKKEVMLQKNPATRNLEVISKAQRKGAVVTVWGVGWGGWGGGGGGGGGGV